MSQAATAGNAAPPIVARETEIRARPRNRVRLLRPLLMLGGIAVVAVGVGYFWLSGGRYVSIDNAYVGAAKVAVSTDVGGIIADVDVREGQPVRKGEVLFRLDPKPFQIAVDAARANLAQVELNVAAMKRDYQRMLKDIATRQVQVQADQVSNDRLANLVRQNAAPQRDYDDARFKLAADQQAVEALRDQAAVQLAKLGGNADVDARATPEYMAAQARLDEAQRQLDHTQVRAPFDGIATQVDSIQPGMFLAAAGAGIGVVSTQHVWIDGNPKETELTYVKPGDHVTITVDTYPGHVWDGHVESIAPASAAQFSILPAQNASGNWVKVVQRIPLRVAVDRREGDPDLRAGMSVEVDIDTGHVRTLADLY